MRNHLLLAAWCFAVSVLGTALAAQEPRTYSFEQDRPDQPPSGFSFASMRQPDAGRWTVQRHGSQSYLVHAASPAATGYAMAIADTPAPGDLAVSARLRFSGARRSGGLVWRYLDAQNFHALVLDLTQREVAIYRIASGNRVRLDVKGGLELDPDAWHVLKVTHHDAEIVVSLGGIRVFEEQDRRDSRSTRPSHAGVLAGGQAEVFFDDFRLEHKQDKP